MNDLENKIIGAMLVTGHMDDLMGLIGETDFDNGFCRQVWKESFDFYQRGATIDPVTIGQTMGELQKVAELARGLFTKSNLAGYAKMLKARNDDRRLEVIGHKIVGLAQSKEADKVEQSHGMLMELSESSVASEPDRVSQVLPEMIERLEERANSGGGLVGLPTGLTDLDKLLCGLRGSQLIILAARPKMGKTALALNMASHAANEGKRVLFFSLEMSKVELVDRLVCSLGRVDNEAFRSGTLDDEGYSNVIAATTRLKELDIYIDDTPALHISEIRSRARLHQRKRGVDLIVVDYIQLAKGSSDNRVHEVSEISQGLKTIAKELDVPVLALSQLNRSLESRDKKRPRLSDLRDSGSIEQDADVVAFIYRDEVYNTETPNPGIAEIIVSAQRNGATGTVPATFIGKHFKFENFAGNYVREEQPRQKQRGFSGKDAAANQH